MEYGGQTANNHYNHPLVFTRSVVVDQQNQRLDVCHTLKHAFVRLTKHNSLDCIEIHTRWKQLFSFDNEWFCVVKFVHSTAHTHNMHITNYIIFTICFDFIFPSLKCMSTEQWAMSMQLFLMLHTTNGTRTGFQMCKIAKMHPENKVNENKSSYGSMLPMHSIFNILIITEC